MSVINLSISDLFLKQFGVGAVAFKPEFKTVVGDSGRNANAAYGGIDRVESNNGTNYYDFDKQGREVYLPIYFSYSGTDGETHKLMLPYCVIGFQTKKTIINTGLTERRGSVAEFINMDGYNFTINGFLINTDANEYPQAEAQALIDLYESNENCLMHCASVEDMLAKNNNRIVIKSLDMPIMKGVKNVRAFTLMVESDEIFNLIEV